MGIYNSEKETIPEGIKNKIKAPPENSEQCAKRTSPNNESFTFWNEWQ